jgi:hypothetical protein
VKVTQRLDPEVQLGSFYIQQVAAMPAVSGNEMKVVPLDTKRARESWRPKTD